MTTQTTTDAAQDLRATMTGSVLTPADGGYDAARSLYNADADRRPAVIAMCTSATDVAAAIAVARRHDLPISVRGGGHSIPGTPRATTD